jgi:hypothetical protein
MKFNRALVIVFIALLLGVSLLLSCGGPKETVIGSGAKGVIAVTANDGTGAVTQNAAGNVNAVNPLTKTATKGSSTATGTVKEWRHIVGAINAQRQAGANASASCDSTNSASSKAALSAKEARPSNVAIIAKIKAHLHDAKPATVVVAVTIKDSNGAVLDQTNVTYTITEDNTNPNKVQMTDGTNSHTVDQGAEQEFDNDGKQFAFPKITPPPANKVNYPIEFSVKVSGTTESVAEVDADVTFSVK